MRKTPLTAAFILILSLIMSACAARGETANANVAVEKTKDERMQWFREARFGMFIHWGLYAIPAGQWGKDTNHAEWIRDTARIPIDTYDKFVDQFNPVKFDPERWAQLASDAGMKYVVITSKHHDGFCLYDSKYTDFDVMSTPFKRDIMKELGDAVRNAGMKMCFYHSIMDWHHPDYLPRRGWESRSSEGADFNRYVTQLRNQVSELLTNYGPIGILWFDGEWESTWNHGYGQPLYELCRKLQPNVIVNNRVDKGRGGMGGMSDAGFAGDYGTPEQQIPARGIPGVDWETCMTMNENWGYNKNDKNFKSTEDLIRKLCDIVSKGGNFLLNVGPTAEGEIPPESVERLQQIGKWMKVNGDAIHGTTASPFSELTFGRCTQKKNGKDTTLYFHVFDWPKDGKLVIGGLGNRIKSADLMAAPGKKLVTNSANGRVTIEVTETMPDRISSVVRVEIEGSPIVYETPRVVASSFEFVNSMNIELAVDSKDISIRYTNNGTAVNAQSPRYTKKIVIDEDTTIRARSFYQGKPVSDEILRRFRKVDPWPAHPEMKTTNGLMSSMMDHTGGKIPEFPNNIKVQSAVEKVMIPKEARRPNVAMRLAGWINVPAREMVQFRLTSDDGSKLAIDGKLIIDNDGNHSAEAKQGSAPLDAGLHRIEVLWYNGAGDFALQLEWAFAGGTFTEIPASAFFRDR
ncbi:MAG: alpha-L-fucosidase [Planctomycetota bacterium]